MADPVFFAASRRFSAGEIATVTGAELADPAAGDVEISGVAPAAESAAGMLIFIDSKRNARALQSARATAVLCTADVLDRVPEHIAALVTPTPLAAFATVARLMFPSAVRPRPVTGEQGVSAHAHIAADATIEPGAIIEAGAIVGAGAAVGSGTVVAPNVVIAPQCRIGRDCSIGIGVSIQNALIGDRVLIHPGVRIGQDGFGYVPGKSGLDKIPQIGRVVIQNDVEIGANTTIDRGTLSDTIIGEGTKIDNLVQIAHNARIGRGCIIAGLSGLSGSVTLGDHVMLGGGVGIADHLTVGAGAQIAAASGLMHDVPAGERWAGAPAKPFRQFFREQAGIARLNRPRNKGNSDAND